MRKTLKLLFGTLAVSALALCSASAHSINDELNCFGIIAGKSATVDGSVLFGHNEDDSGEMMLNVYSVPADPEKGTLKYIWAEFPGMSVADSYMNEYGVCIASDGCPSCEDREDLTDGGVLYEVRTEVAKKARSAREAVRIIGSMVEKYGYRQSGRTYVIADPDEGWICSVVKGRHWVAQRVPDDKVMCIPNYYTITAVDLDDTLNFAGSRDLVDYAVERGWYNPETDGEFNFRSAFHSEGSYTRASNGHRHEAVISYLTDGKYEYSIEGVQPMFTPSRKLGVQDIINMLSIHKETEGNAHPVNVCTNVTILSTVFQLRSWLPREVGCVMWNCPGRPCAELFVPWYLGMETTPDNWHRYRSASEAEEKHFTDTEDKRLNYPDGAYWYYVDRWNSLAEDYDTNISARQAVKDKYQSRLIRREARMQRRLQRMRPERRAKAQLKFTERCLKISQK